MTDTSKPIRVLMVFGKLGLGGGESRTMDLYRRIDRTKVQFDFLVHCDKTVPGSKEQPSEALMALRAPEHYDAEILSLGGRIYGVPRFNGKNIVAYKRAVEAFFAAHAGEWTAVHGHITSTASLYMPAAKRYGAKLTITHLRSAGTDPGLKGLATKALRLPLRKRGFVDYRFSCAGEAAVNVYGKKSLSEPDVRIIPNAIDVKRFAYDETARREIREELGLTDEVFVIGHVGRFHYAKNHEFLLAVFAKIRQERALRTVLLLCGEGERKEEMQALAESLGIGADVFFLGNHSDVQRYYSAFDFFLFPSRYEGLPGTVIEAQASGLPVLMSDSLTKDVNLTDLLERKDLAEPVEAWAAAVLGRANPAEERHARSARASAIIGEAGFDAAVQAERLQKFYLGGGI